MAMMPVTDALQNILTGAGALQPEHVDLRHAMGRTLAAPLMAALTSPPFDASSMDGYAVRAADCTGGSARLRVIGEAAAGYPFAGSTQHGDAVRIFTGAPLPDGADTIVIQEDVQADGALVVIPTAPRLGLNVRPRGQDFHEGDVVLQPGQRLVPRDILLAAASGHAMLAVVRRPVVAILATGDELVEPSDRPGAGQIVSSNSYGLAALVEASGAEAKLIGIAHDDADDLALKINEARGADILVTIGGASVGDHDLVRPALEAAGAVLQFYKVAMRPGKPVFFGTRTTARGLQRILGLPGNPLSAMICARLFLVPLIAALLGRKDNLPMARAALTVPLARNGPRDHYMRAVLDRQALPPTVTPLASQDSSMISALAEANCLIVIAADAPAMAIGSDVNVMMLDF